MTSYPYCPHVIVFYFIQCRVDLFCVNDLYFVCCTVLLQKKEEWAFLITKWYSHMCVYRSLLRLHSSTEWCLSVQWAGSSETAGGGGGHWGLADDSRLLWPGESGWSGPLLHQRGRRQRLRPACSAQLPRPGGEPTPRYTQWSQGNKGISELWRPLVVTLGTAAVSVAQPPTSHRAPLIRKSHS